MEEINKVMGNGLDIEHREWAKIVAQAWADPDFRQRLEKNPRAVLKERGLNIPANINLNITDKPLALEDIERAIKPIDMAVAAGFAAPPMAVPPQQYPAYTPQFNGTDYYTGGYGYPSPAYAGAIDPTLEGKGKVGLCINTRATIGACAFYQWGAGQPFPQQPLPMQQPQAPMPAASYGPPQQQQPQAPMPAASYGPPQQQQPQAPMPAASYGPPQQQQPPTSAWAGDLYSGSMDPTLEGKGKVGLCLNIKATLGACAFFQWGAGQPFPQQPFPTQQPQAPMPPASYGPPQPQQPPTAAWAGDPYSSGVMDPTLEGKGKVGLCINVPVTGGVCAYVHWGTGQPFVAQPMPAATYGSPQLEQPPTAGAVQTLPYYPGDIYSSGAMDPTLEGKGKVGLCISSRVTAGVCAYFHWGAGQPFPAQQPMAQPPTPAASYAVPVQPQQPTAGWAATVPTQCFSGAASPPFVPPGHPSQQPQFHIQPSPGPGPQTRPANPGSA